MKQFLMLILMMINLLISPDIISNTLHDFFRYSETKINDWLVYATHIVFPKFKTNNMISNDNKALKIDEIKMHEYHTNFFPVDIVDTEYTAYKRLKESPIEGVNYLAIPWAVLINRRQLNKVPNIQIKGGFAICQHIRYKQILPLLREMGIDTLFTPHACKDEVYENIKILPFPFNAVNGKEPALQKDILYSFIGYTTHHTRRAIFNMPHLPNTIIKKRDHWNARKEQEKREYRNILARSRFSLCPRGTGPSTIRFWESLQAGAIPVLISNAMCLPKGIDWDTCIIRIAEKDVCFIKEIINNISLEQEQIMRENCLHAYTLFSGTNFVKTIRDYYASMRSNMDIFKPPFILN